MKKIIFIFIVLILIGCNYNKKTIWKDGIIPYEIDDKFSDYGRETIEQAMDEWEQATGKIDFIERTNENLYLTIDYDYGASSSSSVGCNDNGHNIIILSDTNTDTLLHELGHVIGLEHEHQRPDRNDYIIVYYEYIEKKYYDNFSKKKSELYNQTKVAYDYHSIMHYGRWDFSTSAESIFEARDGYNGEFGGDQITPLDIEKVNLLYR